MNDLSGDVAPSQMLRGPKAPHFLRDETLSEIFAATAAAAPGAVCIKTLDRTLTYAAVDAQAKALARGLLAHGAAPGEAVGLWEPRGPELVIAILAVAMTGAAWLPFDAEAPVERIAICMADAGARLLIANEALAPRAKALPCATLAAAHIAAAGRDALPTARDRGAGPESPAFIIYTSGSTGTPKGVAITNRNICHYLRAANDVYGVTSDDVIFQGASAAFDMSVEEIWLAFLTGAALFVATPQIVAETEMLPDVLEKAGVTVLDTAPTLLTVLPRDASSLRIVILGGEAASPLIAERWSRPGRRIFNTYGPTETTVVATMAEMRMGEAVVIGRPIANYTCCVVDDSLRLLPPGVEGELLIGGPGVARGYLNRDGLTAEKFIANPFFPGAGDPILYRTGDAVLIDGKGDLVFRGRIDDQIKIRGFRVELGEIEAALCRLPGVRQAAVALREESGVEELVAFLVATATLNPRDLRAALREALPPYMIPARYEIADRLPRLASNKIDRKALAALPLTGTASSDEQEPPRNETEAALLAAAQRALPPGAIPFDADFFMDLGGHSLLAARFVSALRETPRLASVTLHDLYELRTLRALAARLDGEAAPPPQPACDFSFRPAPLQRRFLCGLAQAVALPFILAVAAAPWLGVFAAFGLTRGAGALAQIAATLAIGMIANVATLLVSIVGKWLVIGRARPGRYRLWGPYYFRWWLAQRLIGLTPASWFRNSPLMPIYLRALGARVGDGAIIGDLHIGAVDLVSIGVGASLGSKLTLANARVEGDELVIGAVEIGAAAEIGTACVIEENSVVGAGAALEDLSALPSGSRIGAGEKWDGSPARRTGFHDESRPDAPQERDGPVVAHALLALILPPLGLLPILPALACLERLSQTLPAVVAVWPAAFSLVIGSVAYLAFFRRLALPRLLRGKYSVSSSVYLRFWCVALAAESVMPILSPLFSTVYAAGWGRLMGARIGRGAELSTNLAGLCDLVALGDDCFVADEASLGEPKLRRGWMTLEPVTLGARVFVGNDAVVPGGAQLPRDTLIGAKSKPPANERLEAGATWFGSPPIRLPAREDHRGAEGMIYRPPVARKTLRAAYEAPSVALPSVLLLAFGAPAAQDLAENLGPAAVVRAALILSFAAIFAAVAVKWATMGRHAPQAKPMCSFWAMRTESSVVLYRGLARRLALEHLRGTPFLPWILRLMGAKIGPGVFLDTTLVTEFDCVSVGGHCALNMQSSLQTHLYEDRVMKVGRVTLGEGVTLGAGSSALYDAHIGDFARLGPLTMVMKGEAIPAQSAWEGAPAAKYVGGRLARAAGRFDPPARGA